MKDKKFDSETGNKSNQDSQVNNSNQESQIDLNSMTNEELIEILKECDYLIIEVSKKAGKYKDFARRVYYKRSIDYRKLKEDHKKELEMEYYNNPKYCKNCGKVIPYEYRFLKDFCNSSCAAKYNNNKNRIKKSSNTKPSSKERCKDNILAYNHNRIIDNKYGHLGIPHIGPGCCPICGEYHCDSEFCKTHSFQQMLGFVEHLGFNPTVIGTKEVIEEFNRVKEMIRKLYWDDLLSRAELGEKFNYVYGKDHHYTMPSSVLDNLGIQRRSLSDAQKLNVKQGKNTLAYQGQLVSHSTWFGTTVRLRSSYELDYAIKLDKLEVRYFVENLRIEYFDTSMNRKRIAIPDFYLPDTNEIIEIKSDFTLDIQEMTDKFLTYESLGYMPKLILEHEEVDLYNIETLISEDRLNRIKTHNIKIIKSSISRNP